MIAETQRRGVTLRQVWEEWRAGMALAPLEKRTLSAAIEECVATKQTAGRRPKYTKDLRCLLRQFARGRERLSVSSIKTTDVES